MAYTIIPGEGSASPDYMIVGEAPGADEELKGRPFIGRSGFLMRYCFGRVGIREEQTYITNVCRHRPPNNQIDKFIPKSKKYGRQPNEKVREGMYHLYKDIAERNPKVIIPVGNVAMWALTGKERISRWRGSVLPVELSLPQMQAVSPYFADATELGRVIQAVMFHKCVPTWHPAAVSRQYNLKPIFEKDLKKAKRETGYPDVRWPKRDITIDPDYETAHALSHKLLSAPRIGADIETPGGELFCVGFASDPSWGFVLRTDEQWKRDLIQHILESTVPKTFHNGLFDTTFLYYHNAINVVNYDYDTMYAHKLYYPEFRTGLDFQDSYYTDEPYYKDEGKDLDLSIADSVEQYLYYCGKDACTMMECDREQHRVEYRNPAHRASVDSHMQLLYIARNMMVRGIRVDMRVMHQLRQESVATYEEIQQKLDLRILEDCYTAAKSHKDPTIRAEAYQLAVRIMADMKQDTPGFNVFSSPDMKFYLYKIRGLKEKRHKKTHKLTAEETALKELYGETGDDTLLQIVKARRERTLQSRYFTPRVAPEGRMVYSVNPVGTKTARWSSGQTIVILAPRKKKRKKEKTGVNIQTLPYKVRRMCVADPGMVLFYADLAQVEDRIVAYAGNVRRKIHAYESGINTHALSAAGYFNSTVEKVNAEKKLCVAEGRTPPMYYMGKQGNHAYNYGEGFRTFKINLNKKADETGVRISEAQSKAIRISHFKLYPEIEFEYWEWIKEQLARGMKLTNPFGYERAFYGRPRDDATNRDGYSWYPQSTAPEIINRAMVRIDKELPEVEMFAHVHDAILGQCPEDAVEEYRPAILKLMEEPLYVRDHVIHVPVDIKFGDNWGSLG